MADALLSDADVGIVPRGASPPSILAFAPGGLMSDDDVGIKPRLTASDYAKDVAKQAGSVAVEAPVMLTAGAPGDIDQFTQPGGAFDQAFLGVAHRLADWTGYGPQKGTPERAKFDKAYLDAERYINSLDPLSGKLPTTHGILGAAGIQLPEPQTAAGRYTRTVGDFAAGAAAGGTPAALARGMEAGFVPAAKTMAGAAAGGVLPGAGTQALTDAANATGNADLAPLAQFAGGPMTHAATRTAAAAGGRLARTDPISGVLDRVGISGPAQDRAAQRFMRTATDPAAVREQLANPVNPEGAPGTQFASISAPGADGTPIFAQPTTPELTQDPGLAVAQRAIMAKRPDAFLPGMAQANEARIRFMQSDPGADPIGVSTHLRDSLDAIHEDAATKADQARTDAQSRLKAAQQAGEANVRQTDDATQVAIDQARGRQTEATQPIQSVHPEALGEALRGPLAELNSAAKTREGELHEAIDPNRQLIASTAPVNDAVRRAYGDMTPTSRAFMAPAERQFLDLISNYKPTESYREMADLSSNLAAAIRTERATNQGNTPALRRMSMVMSGVKDALHTTVQDAVGREAREVALGARPADDTAVARLRDLWGADDGRGADASGVVRRTGTDVGDFPGSRPPGGAGAIGTEPPQARGRGPAPSDQGLPAAVGSPQSEAPRPVTPAHRGPPPQSLITFLQRAGGVRDQGGNLKAAGYDRFPGLITRNGVPLDRAREMAVEAGYLGADRDAAMSNTSVNDLLDAIGGHPHYAAHEQDAVAAIGQRGKEVAYQKAFAAARKDVVSSLVRDHQFQDFQFNEAALNRASYLRMEGREPLEAYELALKQSIDQDAARRAAVEREMQTERTSWDEHFDQHWQGPSSESGSARASQAGPADATRRGSEGAPPFGAQPGSGPPGAGEAAPGVSADVAERIRAANAATRERKATFERGAVGEVLRAGPVAGEYRLTDARVPAKLFQSGPKGYDSVSGYFRAAGDHPQATSAMHAAAIDELAKIVEKNDGVLTEAGLRYYQRRFGDALRAIDERTPGFSRRFDGAANATTEVEHLTGARRAAMREAEDARGAAVKEAEQAGRADVKATEAAGRQASKDYQQGIVKNLLASQNKESVVAHLKTMLTDAKDGVREADRLATAVKGNADAEAALHNGTARAFAEIIVGKDKIAGSDTPMIAKGVRQRFDAAEPMLRKLLPEDHVTLIRKSVIDAERAETAMSGMRIPGGSNTAQDTAALAAHGGGHKAFTLGQLAIFEFVGEHVIKHIPFAGQAAAAGAVALRSLRNMGISSQQKYFEEMIRNPEFAAQMVKRVSPTNDVRQQRITGLIRKSLMSAVRIVRPGDKDDGGSPPSGPNVPPPTGPFSRGGPEGMLRNATTKEDEKLNTTDARGRIEPTLAPQNGGAKPDTPQPNVPLTGRQARTLRAAGYEPAEIGAMSPQERAKAVRDAEAAGFSPEGRITPADRSAMRGALQHAVHDGRTGDGRFAGRGDLLAHPDISGRIEPTWHPDADATHQAILAHERRLDGRQPLAPDASIKDVRKTVDTASGDVLAMVRKSNNDFLSSFRKEMEGMVERGASEPAASAAPAERTFAQQLDDLLKSAKEGPPSAAEVPRHTVYKPGRISFADDVPAGAHQTSDAYETEINGEPHYHAVSFVKDGDTVHAVISKVERMNDRDEMAPAELSRIEQHKLRKAVEGHLEDHVDEQTGEARWNSLTTAEKNAEIEAQERAIKEADASKDREIRVQVEAALKAGWKPEPTPHSSYNWYKAPEGVKQFASPKSMGKIEALLREHGFMPKRKAGDVVPMARRAGSPDQIGFNFSAAEPQRNPLIAGGGDTAAPNAAEPQVPRTPFQGRMHTLADHLDAVAKNPAFGETPSGHHETAYERQRALLGVVKDVSKAIDKVFAEIHRVAGDPDVDYEGHVWEGIKDGLHHDIRERAAEMRSEMRSDPDLIGEHPDRPHVDLRQMAGEIAHEVREVADTNPWIERATAEEGVLHPDDLDHLADQVAGITGRFDDLFNEIDASSEARYLRVSMDSEARELHRREPNHIATAHTLAEDLRNSAAEMREAEGADVAPRLRFASAGASKAPTQSNLSLRNERTGASANAQSVSSFRDAMRASDVSGDPKADNLARASSLAVGHRLTRIIGDMPVFTVGPQEMRTLAQGRVRMEEGHEPAGFFDPKSGHIVVLDDAMRNPQEASRLMIHEGSHGALFHVIENSRAARSVLEHLRESAEAAHVGRGGSAADHYGLKNIHEFMSEAFGNDDFKRFLGSIKADDRLVRALGLQSTGRTMWDAFVAAVRKILGVSYEHHTMLDASLKVGGHLLDMAEAQARPPAAAPSARSPAAPASRRAPVSTPTSAASPEASRNALVSELARLARSRSTSPPASPGGLPDGLPSIGAMQAGPDAMSRLASLLGG